MSKVATTKIYNISDVHTPELTQFRMTDQHIEVCGQMAEPGHHIEIPTEKWEASKPKYARLLKLKALAVGEVPEGYAPAGH